MTTKSVPVQTFLLPLHSLCLDTHYPLGDSRPYNVWCKSSKNPFPRRSTTSRASSRRRALFPSPPRPRTQSSRARAIIQPRTRLSHHVTTHGCHRLPRRCAARPRPAAPRRRRWLRLPPMRLQGFARHGRRPSDVQRRGLGGDPGIRQGCAGRGSGRKLRTSMPWPPSGSQASSRSGRPLGRSRPSTSFHFCPVS